MNKHIEFGTVARRELVKGIDKLADAVVATLGPNGRNVVISNSQGVPQSTKDGVTVAKSITLKEPTQELGVQLLKQAAINTANKAGDGTTTSTLLAREIIKAGLKSLDNGENAVQIKREIDEAVKVGHRIAIMRDGMVIQMGTPEQIILDPADDYVADFVKGISRLKVVEAKTIMKSKEQFEKENGPIPENAVSMKENDLLTKLIEKSVSNNAPIVIHNNEGKLIGAISQKDLLTSVVEGHDE